MEAPEFEAAPPASETEESSRQAPAAAEAEPPAAEAEPTSRDEASRPPDPVPTSEPPASPAAEETPARTERNAGEDAEAAPLAGGRPDAPPPVVQEEAGAGAAPSVAGAEEEAAEFQAWVRSVSPDLLGRAWQELEGRGEWQKASMVVAQLLRVEPERTELLRARAELAERLGDAAEPEAWQALAERLERSGEREGAADAYRRLLAADPMSAAGRAGLERVRRESEEEREDGSVQGRDTESRPSAEGDAMRYPSGANVDPYDPRPRDASPAGGPSLGPPAGPPDDAAGAGVATADGPVPYEGLADGSDSVDFDELLAELKTSLADNETAPDTRSRTEMGAELKEMGLLDEAIRELQAAVREPHAPAEAFELLGESFIEKGQPRIAARLLEKAVEERSFGDRESLGVLYQLGVALQQLGERTEALECYERIFSVDIDYRDIKERILACSD